MEHDLFNLDFTRWQIILLSLIPALVNFGILTLVILKFQKSKTNNLFSIFVFLLGMWQLTEGFMRLSISEETASYWLRISEVFLIFVIPAGIIFILRFTRWEQSAPPNLISILFVLPAVIFFIFVQAKYDSFTIIQSKNVYWIANPNPTPFTFTLLLWIASGALLMVVLLWTYYIINLKNKLKSSQSLLLAIGISFPVIGGITTEVIGPLVFGYENIPVTVPFITAFSIAAFISIKKYKTLDFSPKHHWEQITLNEGLLIINENDEIMHANQTFCLMTGYQLTEIEGKNADILFLERKGKFARFKEIKKNKIPVQYEIELIAKTAEKKSMLVNCSPYMDNNGKIVGSIAVMTDVTFLKIAKQELIDNEARLKKAQKVAHVGSWEHSFLTNKALWSEEACRIHGLSTDEKHQSFESWLSFIHPEDLSHVQKEIEKSQSTLSNSTFRHRIVCGDGTVKHISSASEFIYDDKGLPIGLTGICHDITELMTAQKAFIESEDRMTTFVNESLLCIYFVDPDTKKVLYSNSAFLQLLGYSLSDIESLKMYDFVHHSAEDIDLRIETIIKEGRNGNRERQWKKKNGQIIHMLVSSFYVNKNGKKTVIVAAQDVSERKKAEEALQVTNQELETFIYRASHDLRGPLASIIGLANLSKLEIQDETALKYLSMIGTGTEKLDYTLTELVKSMEIKHIQEFNNVINFEKIVKEALTKFEFFPGYSKLKIKTNISILRSFTSSKFILETIIQNLIENAIKYQNYASSNSSLSIHINEDINGINIIVEDNGLGMDASIQDKIFDMYFRGASNQKGSGLGLYLVKKGIEKLGGRIELVSTLGQGSTFTIKLPSKKLVFLS